MQEAPFRRCRPIWVIAPLAILMALLSLAALWRLPEPGGTAGAQGLQASYHTLLTARALASSSIAHHKLLPTVSLGKDIDKQIPWGATVPGRHGDLIYTSFTPPVFLATFAFFKLFSLPENLSNLTLFNFLLQVLSTVLLYWLVYRLTRATGADRVTGQLCAIAGVSIGIFSREALLSFGLVYWSQQLYQPIFIGALLVLSKILNEQSPSRQSTMGLALLCFLGAWTEWTGFLFNLFVFSLLLFRARLRGLGALRSAAWWVLGATLAAGLLIVAHLSLVVGFEPTMHTLTTRFFARSAMSGSAGALLHGYWLSFGLILPWLVALAFYAFYFRDPSKGYSVWAFVFLAAAFPLLENVLLLQHATQFSYDRLKFVVPAAILAALLLASLRKEMRFLFIGLLAVAFGANLLTYKRDMDKYAEWRFVDARNRQLMVKISQMTDLDCAVIASNQKVRGYDNLVFDRGIYEHKRAGDMLHLMATRGGCSAIFIEGTQAFPDLPSYSGATIFDRDGTTRVISIAERST